MFEDNPSFLSGKKISCIINPNAANKKWKRRKFLRKYLHENLPGQIIDRHKDKAYTIQTANKLSLDHDIIVAAGGDGTIVDVIQGITECGRKKDIALGIIPIGSGNAFRKSLGIPKNVKKSIKLIAEGNTREIDLINIEGKAATFASIGATAQATLVSHRNNVPGFFGYFLVSRIMLIYRRKELEIELFDGIDDSGKHFDKKIFKLKVFDCIIGKTNYFGYSWKIAPKAKIDDGFIDITFFETTALKYLFCFPLIYLGIFQKTQKHFKARKMILRGKNMPIQYNGEVLGIKDEIELKVLPRALNIIVPMNK